MSRDLVLDVIAKKSSRELSVLAEEFERLAKQTDDAGRRFNETTSFSRYLDDEIVKTRVHVHELAQEFERTGSSDVFGKLRGAQGNLRSLEKIKVDLTSALETGVKDAIPVVEDTLASGAQQGSRTFWTAFSSLPPQAQAAIIAALVGVVTVSAPVLGSALGGAIVAGVGGLGIGAGIAGQIHDPLVHAALTDLKNDFLSTYHEVTEDFAPVAARAAGTLDRAVHNIAPGLKSAFSQAAPYAEKFFDGVGEFIEKIEPGLEKAMVVGSQILASIGERDLPELARSISGFLEILSSGGKEGADALHLIFIAVESIITGVGYLIASLEGLFRLGEDVYSVFQGILSGDWTAFLDQLTNLAEVSDDTTVSVKALNAAQVDLTQSVRDASAAFDEYFGKQMSVDQANDALKAGLLELKDNLDRHSRSLEDNTLAGLHNRDVVRGLIQQAEAARQAQIDMAGGADASKEAIDKANGSYQAAIQQIVTLGVKAGLSKKDLEALVGQYRIDVLTVHTDVYSKDYRSYRADERRTLGGPVMAGKAYTVGEQDEETFVPDVDGYILPNTQVSRAGYATPFTGGAGGGRFEVGFAASGDQIVAALLALLRPYIRSYHGGDVTAALAGAS